MAVAMVWFVERKTSRHSLSSSEAPLMNAESVFPQTLNTKSAVLARCRTSRRLSVILPDGGARPRNSFRRYCRWSKSVRESRVPVSASAKVVSRSDEALERSSARIADGKKPSTRPSSIAEGDMPYVLIPPSLFTTSGFSVSRAVSSWPVVLSGSKSAKA